MANGRPKTPGQLQRTGVGAPSPLVGGEGDLYRDLVSGLDYLKVGGSWGQIVQPNLPATKITGTLADAQINDLSVAKVSLVQARATRTGSQVIGNAAWTLLLWDSEDIDTNLMHDNSTNTERLTCPAGQAGRYEFAVNSQSDGAAAGLQGIAVQKNSTVIGTNVISGDATPNLSGISNCVQATGYVDLAVGDWIVCLIYQNSGANMNMNRVGSYFTATRIH